MTRNRRNRNRQPAQRKAQDSSIAKVSVGVSNFRGPIPPPEVLAGYEQVLPGSPERILRMAEEQARHRISMEAAALQHEMGQSIRGLWTGLAVAVVGIAAGSYVAYLGNTGFGIGVIVMTIGSIVTAYLTGIHTRRKERERRVSMLSGQD